MPHFPKRTYILINYAIASIWIANGLFCKVMNLVPRHTQIVARILGNDYARELTIMIGISEILMAIWIISGYKSKINSVLQMVIIAVMNSIEFALAPDLLLWGRFNSLYAFILVIIIYLNQFYIKVKSE